MEGNTRRSKRIQQRDNVSSASTLDSDMSASASPEFSSTKSTCDNASAKAATRKPRPPKRQKLKADPQANLYDVSQPSDASQNGAVAQQAARPDPAWIRGRRGHLKFITEVPLDVLYEIFSELDPIDLLHLSWSCKSLHAIVMSKLGKRLWETAFARLYESEHPPPRCPDDLNLAQYARFLFVNKCMDCETGPGKWDSWGMRLRVCWDCLQSNLFSCAGSSENGHYRQIIDIIRAKNHIYYRYSECIAVSKIPDYVPEGKQLREQYGRKLENRASYYSWKCHQIKTEQKRLEAMRLTRDSMRLTRKPAILQKLCEIGWKESEIEEITGHKVNRLPGFSRSKPFTDKEWDTLRPQLVDRLQELKRAHMEQIKEVALRRRYSIFEDKFSSWRRKFDFPWSVQAVDLAIIEPFRSALFTFPSDNVQIEFSVDQIDRAAKEWIDSPHNLMLSLLPPELRDSAPAQPNTDERPTQDFLASLIFRCGSDSIMLGYRSAGKLRLEGKPSRCPGDPELAASLALVTRKIPWEWEHPKISFYPEAHETAKHLITLLGEDPNTVTFSQMSRCERKFVCRWCSRRRPLCYMLAVGHAMHNFNNHKGFEGYEGTQWRVVG